MFFFVKSNEWFAKDTSRKVKAALRAKHAAGQRICTYAPLGYKKHPEIKNGKAQKIVRSVLVLRSEVRNMPLQIAPAYPQV